MQFSPEQRNLVVQAMDEAEIHTTRYYCIPPHRWQQVPYDLLTREDTEWEPLPDPILARVQCVQKVSPKPLKSYDFYRIQLNDPSILSVAHRDSLVHDLYPFLVYILTHEMVHMVRLSSILGDERHALQPCETEEQRVQWISSQILSNEGRLNYQPILDRFCSRRW